MAEELQQIVESEKEIALALKWAESNLKVLLWSGEAALFVGRPRRSLDQNDKMWPMLRDISRQVEWFGERLTEREWKDVMTAALKKQRVVPGIDGGVVMVGGRTSRMNRAEMSDLIEIMMVFGSERGVTWSEPAKKVYEEYRRAT